VCFFFFQAEDGIRDRNVTGVQTCALPIFSTTSRTRTSPPPCGREVGEAADGGGDVRVLLVVEIAEDGGRAGGVQLVQELVRVGVDVRDQVVEARLAGGEQVPAGELVDPAGGELLELVVLVLRCRGGEA